MAVASAKDAILQKWKDAAPPFYILIFFKIYFIMYFVVVISEKQTGDFAVILNASRRLACMKSNTSNFNTSQNK